MLCAIQFKQYLSHISLDLPFTNQILPKIAGPSLTAWRSEVALRGRTDVTQLEGVVVNKLEPGNTQQPRCYL
jgi:hypothetical protein